MLDFYQDAPEETQVMTTLTEADHAADDIFLVALLARIVYFFQVEFLRDGDKSLQDAGAFRFNTPAEIKTVHFGIRPLQKVFVATLMHYSRVPRIEHVSSITWSLILRIVRQAVTFFLNELVFDCLEE